MSLTIRPGLAVLLPVFILISPAASPADDGGLWASLDEEGIRSLGELVPGAPPPDPARHAKAMLGAGTAADAELDDTSAGDAVEDGDDESAAIDPRLAGDGQPSDWRGMGSYRNYNFDGGPRPLSTGDAREPGAWPQPEPSGGGNPADDVDAYRDYYGYNGAPPAGQYGYGYGSASGAARGYGGPGRLGGGRGGYEDYDEDWEPDDGE